MTFARQPTRHDEFCGAFDFIIKPLRKEQILLAIDKAMRWREMVRQNKELNKKLEASTS